MTNKDHIIEISKRLGLTHISSNVSCLPILEHLYTKKERRDIVILDNAHAHLAHLVVASNHNPPQGWYEEMIEKHGIHCDRKAGCDASGGSLGHGLGISIGYALSDPTRQVYVIVSDGSMQEGSNWEALRIIDQLNLKNLHIHCNFNGYTALADVDSHGLYHKMRNYAPWANITYWETDNGEGFEGVGGHYKKP